MNFFCDATAAEPDLTVKVKVNDSLCCVCACVCCVSAHQVWQQQVTQQRPQRGHTRRDEVSQRLRRVALCVTCRAEETQRERCCQI